MASARPAPPKKIKALPRSQAYVVSLLPDGRWIIVDRHHGDAEIRYPGTPLEAMEASAKERETWRQRRGVEGQFIACEHDELEAYGIEAATRITRPLPA